MKFKKELIILLLPVILILILVVIKSIDKNSFELSAKDVHELSLKQEHIFSVKDYKDTRISKLLHQLVDLRSKSDFEVDHLKGAINIPVEGLLESKKIESGRIAARYIFYSENMAKTTRAWTLLKQKGYKNIYILDIPKEFISNTLFEADSLPVANEELKYTFQPDTNTRLE